MKKKGEWQCQTEWFGRGFLLQIKKEPGDFSIVFVISRVLPGEYTPDPKPMEQRAPPKLKIVA